MSSKSGGAKTSRREEGIKVISDNRRARYDYEILQTFEAGVELKGSEVKSLRTGHTNLAEAYAAMKGGELFLINSNIPEYREANRFNHEPKRPRKLLLHKKRDRQAGQWRAARGPDRDPAQDVLQPARAGEGRSGARPRPQAA